ncbi:N-(5'-phosphoribosyl)anthranilate isomerase [Taibaiella sp. KBW10]|uniref:phosphoribosylanthranilate isomerase n=1 Tax=Taibaiella sp. KBW10 TaxID=2153357 RepID=UPI000F590587|nr:phosphoribosylanthranilate isomerase [Taibaiella sp. KBW10]RQO29817.1 N-(5'-phosphoribosyl)anthranilate isomerase [Taibaiella sp. KBW10]
MEIKICGLCHTENIQSVVDLRPDYIGFIFYPGSKRYLAYEAAKAKYIAGIQHIAKTGVFVNAGLSLILETAKVYGLDYIQLHGSEDPLLCATLSRAYPVIKAFSMHPEFDFRVLSAYEASCRHYLFDTATAGYGGSGQQFDWGLLEQYTLSKPFFLSGGIGPEQAAVLKRFQHPGFKAIDLNSRFEEQPGLKNISLLNKFIYEIRN